jgi:hypothetical protein
MIDAEGILGRSLDVGRDRVAMQRSEDQRTQDEHVQGSLQQFHASGGFLCHECRQ